MEPLVSRLIVQAAPRVRTTSTALLNARSRPESSKTAQELHGARARRCFSIHASLRIKERERPFDTASAADSHYSQPAHQLSQNVTDEEKHAFQAIEKDSKKMQVKSPWMRDGSDVPPVLRKRSAGAMVKGKLLTTPSRMLKLILPLTTKDTNKDRKDVEPLALLVHPQQPLSYLERLIQSELPFMEDEKSGRERAPSITFRAEDSAGETTSQEETAEETEERHRKEEQEAEEDIESADDVIIDGKREKTGKLSGGRKKEVAEEQNQKESAPHDPDHANFVRWSPSTEIGDFIRDASSGKEFAVDIEGIPESIYVGVPSFQDRSYYLRTRLRKISNRISTMADLKRDCDKLAHRGAKNMARLGFGGLIGWWGAVYYLTFMTDLGWDVMEPVTYLVGLSGLIGGYLWFLYHNREVSYKSAMHVTVSKRQGQLYQQRGFDLHKWEMLIEEGNRLRREIKMIADEYDVEWDETKDEGDEKVVEALRKERKKKENGKKEKKDDDEEEEED